MPVSPKLVVANLSGTEPLVNQFVYLPYILDLVGNGSQVVAQLIEGTDHLCAKRSGRLSVLSHTQKWLHSWFPYSQSNRAAVRDAHIPAWSEEQGYASQEDYQRRTRK